MTLTPIVCFTVPIGDIFVTLYLQILAKKALEKQQRQNEQVDRPCGGRVPPLSSLQLNIAVLYFWITVVDD
jgi:hypothetical protein